jgi:hypothetical protein
VAFKARARIRRGAWKTAEYQLPNRTQAKSINANPGITMAHTTPESTMAIVLRIGGGIGAGTVPGS